MTNLIKSKALCPHGFSGLKIPCQNVMLSLVRAVIKNDKIRDAVIKPIPVNVVNMFCWQELPPKMPLHGPAVNESILAVNVKGSIAMVINGSGALMRIVAIVATEEVLCGIDSVRGLAYRLPAVATETVNALAFPVSAKTGKTAKGNGTSFNIARALLNQSVTKSTLDSRHVVNSISVDGVFRWGGRANAFLTAHCN